MDLCRFNGLGSPIIIMNESFWWDLEDDRERRKKAWEEGRVLLVSSLRPLDSWWVFVDYNSLPHKKPRTQKPTMNPSLCVFPLHSLPPPPSFVLWLRSFMNGNGFVSLFPSPHRCFLVTSHIILEAAVGAAVGWGRVMEGKERTKRILTHHPLPLTSLEAPIVTLLIGNGWWVWISGLFILIHWSLWWLVFSLLLDY